MPHVNVDKLVGRKCSDFNKKKNSKSQQNSFSKVRKFLKKHQK